MRRLLGMVVVAAAVSVVVVGPGARPASAAPTKSLPYGATLSTSNQSMWGAGGAGGPSDLTDTWFDQKWDASSPTVGGITHIGFDICSALTGGLASCPADLGDYGATANANTSGEIGMSDTLHGVTGGSVGVNYPIGFNVNAPADQSYGPGDTVRIDTTAPSCIPIISLLTRF